VVINLKLREMIHLINFLIKAITYIVLMPVIGWCLIIMATIFWNGKYLDYTEDISKSVWNKKLNP
jgi:hypothetical protein